MFYHYDDDPYTSGSAGETPAEPAQSAPVDPMADPVNAAVGAQSDAGTPAESAGSPVGADGSYRMRFSEPWRDPVYKEPEPAAGNAYSPNYHNAGTYSQPHYSSVQTPPPAPKKSKEKKERKGRFPFAKALCLVLICTILSTAASVGISYSLLKSEPQQTSSTQVILGSAATADGSASSPETTAAADGTLSSQEIYDLACKQVVGVSTDVATTNVFGQASSSPVTGSGFIISEDGYILTNYHVIEYAAEYDYDLEVILYDGTSYDASIIGYEADNDVAVIKIDAAGLNAVTLGNSSNMSVGDTVYTVGNPLGELAYTMTSGIVSALDRMISVDQTTTINMFQFDAAVNPGNSGGPVYNQQGEVIGIVSAKYASTGVEGLGFAIPISEAVDIATQLIENGYVTGKAYLGISIMDISDVAAQYYNIPSGAYVYSVNPGSCAEAAGIQAGDVIIKIGNTDVTCKDDLKLALKNYSAGSTATLTISRSGETFTVTVTFDESLPNSGSAAAESQQEPAPDTGSQPNAPTN